MTRICNNYGRDFKMIPAPQRGLAWRIHSLRFKNNKTEKEEEEYAKYKAKYTGESIGIFLNRLPPQVILGANLIEEILLPAQLQIFSRLDIEKYLLEDQRRIGRVEALLEHCRLIKSETGAKRKRRMVIIQGLERTLTSDPSYLSTQIIEALVNQIEEEEKTPPSLLTFEKVKGCGYYIKKTTQTILRPFLWVGGLLWKRQSLKLTLYITLVMTGLATLLILAKKVLLKVTSRRKTVDETTKLKVVASLLTIIANTFTCVKTFIRSEDIYGFSVVIMKKAQNPISLIKCVLGLETLRRVLTSADARAIKARTKLFFNSLYQQNKEECDELKRRVEEDPEIYPLIVESEKDYDLDYKIAISKVYPELYNVDDDVLYVDILMDVDYVKKNPTFKGLYDANGDIIEDLVVGKVYGTGTTDYVLGIWEELGPQVRFMIISTVAVFLLYLFIYFVSEPPHHPKCVYKTHARCHSSTCKICKARSEGVDCGYAKCSRKPGPKLKRVKGMYVIEESVVPPKDLSKIKWWEQHVGDWADETLPQVTYESKEYEKYAKVIKKFLVEFKIQDRVKVGECKGTKAKDVILDTGTFKIVKVSRRREKKDKKITKSPMKTSGESVGIESAPTQVSNEVVEELIEGMIEEKAEGLETIIVTEIGPEQPVTAKLMKERISILSGDTHVGGGMIVAGKLVTADHVIRTHYPSRKIGTEVRVLIRKTDKICVACVERYDKVKDIIALKMPAKYEDGSPILGLRSSNLKSDYIKPNSRVTIFYEDEKQNAKITSGMVETSEEAMLLHNASTERGSSGEPVFWHGPGNAIVGMHIVGGKLNGAVPSPVLKSFLASGSQFSKPVFGKEN